MKPNRLCTICARGGSKGFKDKNIKDFFGKPLIAHVLSIAQASKLFDVIAVSSDSAVILEIAKAYGADFVIERPESMATDTAAKLPAIQHAADQVQRLTGKQFDIFCDISVTSPLMLPEDIIGAVALLESTPATNVITGTIAKNSPYFSQVESNNQGFVDLSKKATRQYERRQDCPITYDMNGAIYVWQGASFFNVSTVITEKTSLYQMPDERSIDIDTEFDFRLTQFIYGDRMSMVQANRLQDEVC